MIKFSKKKILEKGRYMLMFNIVKQSDRATTYVTEFVADEEADVTNLPTTVAPGSTCIVIASSNVYMLNNKKEWKQI